MTGVVLMYHRVAAPVRDPYGISVRPERFVEHVEHLAALGSVVPMDEVLAPSRAGALAITFDDGYADNATTAVPLLAQAGLPATFFITTATLGGRRFWWDRLATGLLGDHPLPEGADVEVAGRGLWLDLHDGPSRDSALRFLHRRLRPLEPNALLATVDDVLARLGVPAPDDDAETMTREQVRAMAASPLVEIGAHTRTHLQLADQREALQREEVVGSVEDLTTLLGRPVTSFAYPFGSPRAVGDLAPRLAQEAGCRLAVSTDPGVASRRSDRYRLPRLNVRDWTGAELVERIGRLSSAG